LTKVIIGMGTCGLSAGARSVYETLQTLQPRSTCEIGITGCIGMCYAEPLVEIRRNGSRAIFGNVDPKRAEEIFRRHIVEGVAPESDGPAYFENADGSRGGSELEFLASQRRIVLRNCGTIDPESIDEYIASGGYQALSKALREMTPEGVIEEIKASGLRGRGGAGFPTGVKWSLTASAKGKQKYVVCNADEGDPGAFMDRSVLESDPQSVIEGMIICAYAVGSHEGYIYCRAEYPLAIRRLNIALDATRKAGFLGKNILGSGFSFDVKIKQGAGAFVCGEETALFASIEGRRGMPRIRPPYPAEKGLWGKPTNNNNVETYANVPWIIVHGAESYASFGTEKSRGTKVFALAGRVVRGGLAEVAMGTTIRDLVFKIGGGIKEGHAFKAVQIGGPSGGCIPAELGDTPVDFESISRTGAIMGSGGMVVLDDTTCMVEIARFFLDFTQKESCGKCTFCRIGTLRMLEILERITRGEAAQADVEKLARLAAQVRETSLCGLGQTAPNPVLTTLNYYRAEYEAHTERHKCPAASCNALVDFHIDAAKCNGCGLCARQCPVGAISGKPKEPHAIDHVICSKCGKCLVVCTVNCIYRT